MLTDSNVGVLLACPAFLVKYLEQCSIRLGFVDVDSSFVFHCLMDVGITLPQLLDIYNHLFKSRVSGVISVLFNCKLFQSINQSINAEFVGRRYTTRPGAPAESVKSTIKKYILESFSKCTGISNIIQTFYEKLIPPNSITLILIVAVTDRCCRVTLLWSHFV